MKPNKDLGQHFLNDAYVLNQIITSSSLNAEDVVIEIGPGLGALTEPMLQYGARVIAFEKDERFVSYLRRTLAINENLTILEQDGLKVNWDTQVPETSKFISNIPYQITAPLLFNLLEYRHKFQSLTIVMQQEVALRLVATADGECKKDYSALTVIFQYAFSIEIICHIPPEAFSPPPKVYSSAVLLKPKKPTLQDEKGYFAFIRSLFNQRRKQIGSKLASLVPQFYNSLEEAEQKVWKKKRAQELNTEEFMFLYTMYLKENISK